MPKAVKLIKTDCNINQEQCAHLLIQTECEMGHLMKICKAMNKLCSTW